MQSEFLQSLDVSGAETPVLAEFLHAWDAGPGPFVHGPETRPLRVVIASDARTGEVVAIGEAVTA